MVHFHRVHAVRGSYVDCKVFTVFIENGVVATRRLGFAIFDASGDLVGELLATMEAAMAKLEELAGPPNEPKPAKRASP